MPWEGYIQPYQSDTSYSKVFDADFQILMKGMGFGRTPREHFTINNMERHYAKMLVDNREYLEGRPLYYHERSIVEELPVRNEAFEKEYMGVIF